MQIRKGRACVFAGIACATALLAGALWHSTAPVVADETGVQEYGSYPDVGMPASGFPKTGTYMDQVDVLDDILVYGEKNAENAESNAPLRYIDRWGFLVQPTASDPLGWNNTYRNADNRGCNSCHSYEDVLLSLPTQHRLTFVGYPQPQTVANCMVCHSTKPSFKESMHNLHNASPVFRALNGSCESCHYIDDEGTFLLWDFYKYDVETGIVEVDAETAAIEVSYDQDTITDPTNYFYMSLDSEPNTWLTGDEDLTEEIAENWVVSFTGDIENPCDMTLPELIEKFGTEDTEILKNHCVVNGVGQAMIMQVEVGGIDLQKLVDYLQPKEGCNLIRPYGSDGYHTSGFMNAIPLEYALNNHGILVTEMNGQRLEGVQGYPLTFYFGNTAAADHVRQVTGISFETVDSEMLEDPTITLGTAKTYIDNYTGEIWAKPNAGVLNLPNGIVLENQVGNPVHLEGFADAYEEPVQLVEFSLDRGQTWTEMEVVDVDTSRWVYWRLDYTPQEAGSHLLTIRTTSLGVDGTEHTCTYDTQFLFNVE